MPQLLFLTGAPGSGKSTIARLLVAERPLSLLLDLDLLRGTLGAWRADPTAAGVRARALGLELARAQLERGGDVVAPQFVRRPQLIEQFRDLAERTGSRFVLVALVSSPAEAESRFAARAGSTDPVHSDAAHLQSLAGAEPVSQLYTGMLTMLTAFPQTRFVETIGGDVEGTLARVRAHLDGDQPGGGGPS